MLMMRPQRAFIMPRITARERRNTDFRLVSMTSSQSASFMRSARLSRVMPALLTRIAIAPTSFSISASAASVCAISRTFITLPTSPASAIACAPASPVAVPTTLAPCFASSSAIARPIPREAPVTSATLPASISAPFHCGERLLERGAVGGREALQLRLDALHQAREHLARAAFDDVRDALRGHAADDLDPAHRRRGLPHECVLDIARFGFNLHVDIVDDRYGGNGKIHSIQETFQLDCSGLHEAAVKRRTD